MGFSSVLAAKADNDKWLPLSQHLEDTGNVMRKLMEQYVAPSVYEATGLEFDCFRRVALFVAYVHDIGKATSAFQKKMCDALPGYRAIIKEQGFDVKTSGVEERSPHALAGAAILNRFFGIDESICEVVASHHGKPLDNGKDSNFRYQLGMLRDNYYSEENFVVYKESWTDIIDKAKSIADVDDIQEIPTKAQILLTGLLTMADWIASCGDFFPLLEIYEKNVSCDRTSNGMAALALQPYHDFNLASMSPTLFEKRFGFLPNEMQKIVLDISNKTITPGIMIIEAPMGLGKTEAALAAAELESCAAGTGGVFFGLPTRGTADAMFDRVKGWAELISNDNPSSITLAHSSAGFNDSYTSLRTKIYDENRGGISVNSWMVGRYKKLLPDFAVGTVDQAFFTVLKRKFFMLLHLGISGKTVIIDEVHSYDDYMTEYMKSMLSWLGAYRVPVILLSATLTKEKRKELICSYVGEQDDDWTDAYPAITWTDDGKVFSASVETETIKKMDVYIEYTDKQKLGIQLSDILSEGGCAGVICDTVSRAQDVYYQLKCKMDGDYTVILIHSRFLPKDRAELEKEIISLVGKKSIERNKIIVVGTQVLEQSLDIDFDVLFTEKCPIDLLFQRLGRLHRHLRDKRPEKLKIPKCFIFADEDSCKSARIYDDYIIRRADEALSDNQILRIPGDIRKLTEDVYDLSKGSDGKDKQSYIKRREELKRLSRAFLLPNAEKCKFKGALTIENTGNNNDSVRFGLNSIDMILLKRKEECYETFSGTVIQRTTIPDEEQTKELLKNKLSLRYDDELVAHETDEKNIDSTELKLWKRNCYLENEHFLVADEDGVFRIGKHSYSYSQSLGWRREE